MWTRVGAVVARRPRLVWVATTVVLLALCGGLLQLRADGVPLRADIMTVEEMAVELCRSKFGA